MSHDTHTPNRTRCRGRNALTAAALTTALVAAGPAAGAGAQQDLRSPDARNAGLASEARDYQDLRSPDARDSGRVTASPAPTPTPADSGTDWGDVGIIAGGALLVVGLGGAALLGRRRSVARKTQSAVAPR